MKIDDLITEAPMGILKHVANKVKSFVPGSYGSRAQGDLDVGRVANQWKKDYAHYLGQIGAEDFGNTQTFITFLKNLGFTHQQMSKVFKGGGYLKEELSLLTELKKKQGLTSRMIDTLMMRAARVAAGSRYGSTPQLPKEPNPTAPREPGAVDAAVGIGQKVVPGVAKAAGQVGAKLGKQAFDWGKQTLQQKGAAQQPKQRIEPTMGTPRDTDFPKPSKDISRDPTDLMNFLKKNQYPGTEFAVSKKSASSQPTPKFEPSRKAPQMKTKPVTKYK